jgi:hypothetical protein
LIRDRDGKFPELSGTMLADAGTGAVLSSVRMPRMNSIMERWVQTCRRELLDRTLIWNQHHLLHALRESGRFCNGHRPHQGIANAAHSGRCLRRSSTWTRSPTWTYEDANAWAGSSTNTSMPPDVHG